MKTTTHVSLHEDLNQSAKPVKSRQDSEEVEATVWVMIAIFAALIAVFAYLFWSKF